MADIIKLKPFEQISTAGLERGELAIDEAARRLYISTPNGVEEIPLDVTSVPKPTEQDVADGKTLVMGPAGPRYADLIAGAGAIPMDAGAQRWCIPGVTPVAVLPNRTFSSPWFGIFEVCEPTMVTAMRAAPIGGVDIPISYGIRSFSGQDLARVYESAYAGPVDTPVDVTLEPGRYLLFLEVGGPLEFQVVRGFLPWTYRETYYPIYLRVT